MISSIRSALSAAVVHFEREEGQTMAEYGLILALIAAVSIISLGALGLAILGELDAITAVIPWRYPWIEDPLLSDPRRGTARPGPAPPRTPRRGPASPARR